MTPEEKAILKSMEEERDKLKDALEKAKQRETELNQRSKDEGLDQASQLSPELRSEVERLAQMAMENIELKNAVTKLRQTGSVPEKYWDDFIQKHQWSPDLLAQKARLDDMARQRDALKDALDRLNKRNPNRRNTRAAWFEFAISDKPELKQNMQKVKDLSQERDRLKEALRRLNKRNPNRRNTRAVWVKQRKQHALQSEEGINRIFENTWRSRKKNIQKEKVKAYRSWQGKGKLRDKTCSSYCTNKREIK
ncbi:hypothetical protein RTP6_007537 [Batrachochytrium dendrobatidis]